MFCRHVMTSSLTVGRSVSAFSGASATVRASPRRMLHDRRQARGLRGWLLAVACAHVGCGAPTERNAGPPPIGTVGERGSHASNAPPRVSAGPVASAHDASTAPLASAVAPEDEVIDASPTAEGAPAALYAELFATGTEWTVSRTHTSSSTKLSDAPQVQGQTKTLTCSVRSIEARAWGLVSSVDCPGLRDDLVGPDPIGGYWVATRVGLFHFATDPGPTPPALTRSASVLLATPTLEVIEHAEADDDRFGPGWSKSVSRSGSAWCSTQITGSGERITRGACIELGRGFVRAHSAATVGVTAYLDAFVLVRTSRGHAVTLP